MFDREKVLDVVKVEKFEMPLRVDSGISTKEWTFSFLIFYNENVFFDVHLPERFRLKIHKDHNHIKLHILQHHNVVWKRSAYTFENSKLSSNTWLEFRFGASNLLQKAFFEIKNVADQTHLLSLHEEPITIDMSATEPSYIEFEDDNAGASGIKIREIRLFGEYLPSINGNSSAPMSPHNFHKPLVYYRMNENYGNIVYDSAELGSKYRY